MKSCNRLVAVLLLAGAGLFCQWSVNAEPKDLEIAFVTPTVQPAPGIPDGRRDKTAERPLLRTHGSFHELVRDQIAALRVTWWDEDRFKNREETESFVRSLLIAPAMSGRETATTETRGRHPCPGRRCGSRRTGYGSPFVLCAGQRASLS